MAAALRDRCSCVTACLLLIGVMQAEYSEKFLKVENEHREVVTNLTRERDSLAWKVDALRAQLEYTKEQLESTKVQLRFVYLALSYCAHGGIGRINFVMP